MFLSFPQRQLTLIWTWKERSHVKSILYWIFLRMTVLCGFLHFVSDLFFVCIYILVYCTYRCCLHGVWNIPILRDEFRPKWRGNYWNYLWRCKLVNSQDCHFKMKIIDRKDRIYYINKNSAEYFYFLSFEWRLWWSSLFFKPI